MAMLAVRNLDPIVLSKLTQRAAWHGRSVEDEAVHILSEAVAVEGSNADLVEIIRRHFDGVDADLDLPERSAASQRSVDV